LRLKPPVYVLRLGHRRERDKRVTTHVALVGRAFGARGFFLAGECDWSVIESVSKVEALWGRGFEVVSCVASWKSLVSYWKQLGWRVVHLTMYGLPLSSVIGELKRENRPILVVVGAEKVPQEVFELSDLNVSITDQPHSEVGALAVFLDRLYDRLSQSVTYEGARIRVAPSPRGKVVIRASGPAEVNRVE